MFIHLKVMGDLFNRNYFLFFLLHSYILIELKSNKEAELKFGDDYLLKYFLDYETRENPSLLNIDQLKNPFSYKLKVNLEEVGEPQEIVVDMPETFNYLLGLKVKKIKARIIPPVSPLNKGGHRGDKILICPW